MRAIPHTFGSRWPALGVAAALTLASLTPACSSGDDTSVILPPDTTTNAAVFNEKAMALTMEGGVLTVKVPIGNPGRATVDGSVTLTLKDLGGLRVSREALTFSAPPGGTVVTATLRGLAADASAADLADHVLVYAVDWSGGRARGTRSAFDALEKLQVLLMTDTTVEVGEAQHVSLFALDPATSRPLDQARVELTLSANGETRSAFAMTDASGHAALEVAPPEGEVGSGTLSVRVVGPGSSGSQLEELPVTIVRSRKVLVTTDKPLYQPGQVVHLRSLALKTTDKTPEAGAELILEIEDAKGNKVARERLTTDAFGVASFAFPIARQVNLGTWKLRVTMGDTVSEKTIAVDRYVLPKFKVEASLDQRWYRPGAAVTLSGQARYFFGKPVANATVEVTASTFDVDFTPFASATTRTDADGRYQTTVTIPQRVVGLPLEQGKGLMKLEVRVTDGAEHVETTSRSATIARGAVDVALVPEGGRLVPGVENALYVVTSDPEGGPVAALVELELDGETAQIETASSGIGEVRVLPTGSGAMTIKVTVTAAGEKVSFDKKVAVGADTETVLVRSDKAVYRAGDTATVDVLVADAKDKVWLDVVHGGRTVMLETATVEDGKAQVRFDVDQGLTGEVQIGAWYVTDRGVLVRDQRMVFVQPDDELSVSLVAQEASYTPGGTAAIDVTVKGQDGRGVVAAVGVSVVDEAVFALQESQPGLLKVFFDLARELSAPVISTGCGSCDATAIIRGDEAASPGYEDKARVAFAALARAGLHGVERDTFKAQIDAVRARLKPRFDAEKDRVIEEIGERARAGLFTEENIALVIGAPEVFGVDPWGHPYDVAIDEPAMKATFTSRGPDERAGTVDDMGFEVGLYEALYKGRGWWGGDDWDADFAGEPMPGMGPPNAGANEGGGVTGDDEGAGGVKVRQDFPETLYVNPAVITDASGRARFEVPLADSITTWRMSGLASSQDGRLGSATGGIVVFQDFFVDIAFPVAVTQDDVLQVPVAVYNYLATPQTVTLDLQSEEWFEALSGTSQVVSLAPGEVRGARFTVRARSVGRQGLTVLGRGLDKSDAVRRTVEVRPNGKAIETSESARFAATADGPTTETVTRTVTLPETSIAGSQILLIKVYPGFMSQVVEGMESLLRLPGGCFEQTTSSAWPNVLVTDYLNQTGALNEALAIKARTYISEGYQRLLTFECASGGFNWWEGDNPGNAVLSAVGIMMFTDTKNVAFVDDQVIVRAARYLAQTQQSDGSWTEERHLHSGNENLGAGSLRATAYITWALQHAGREPATVDKALGYLRGRASQSGDVYTTALVTLALAKKNPNDPLLAGLTAQLHEARIEEGGRVRWSPDRQTMVGGWNDSGDIETTAMVALALMEARAHVADVGGAIDWLVSKKDRQGNWGYSTQATVLTLKALIASLSAGAAVTDAEVVVKLDGEVIGTRRFDEMNADVLWQLDASDRVGPGTHTVTLEYAGEGNLMWQVATTHYLPWSEVGVEAGGPLAIEVDYDKTTLAIDDVINVTVTVTNSDPNERGMMMAELGLPPGFDLDASRLDAILGQGQVARYERTPLRLVVYLEPILPGRPVVFEYALRATEPLEATAPESEAYAYYNRSVRAESRPVRLTVH